MFVQRLSILFVLVAVTAFLALSAARPSSGAGPERTYTVRSGDTLWSIASARYGGDPRAAVWEIQHRNHVDGGLLVPGTVLRLPAG
jgi:nucleoid-associated protein YgaU